MQNVPATIADRGGGSFSFQVFENCSHFFMAYRPVHICYLLLCFAGICALQDPRPLGLRDSYAAIGKRWLRRLNARKDEFVITCIIFSLVSQVSAVVRATPTASAAFFCGIV